MLVVNSEGETTYSVIRGKLAQIDAHQWLGNGLNVLLAQTREALGDEETVSGLLSAEGHPAMAAAAVMTAGGSDVEEAPGPASILLFVDVLDSGLLLHLGQRYTVEGLRVRDEAAHAERPLIKMQMLDGSPLAFTWTVSQPGRYLMWMTMPVLAVVTLGLGLLAWLLLRQALKTVKLMDANYIRLSKSRTALAASEERFRDVAEAASDWIWETDQNARLTYLQSLRGNYRSRFGRLDWPSLDRSVDQRSRRATGLAGRTAQNTAALQLSCGEQLRAVLPAISTGNP